LFNNLEKTMQLVLSPPDGLKNWILFANELAGDENYVAHEPSYLRCPDSERWEVDRIIREEAEAAGHQTPHLQSVPVAGHHRLGILDRQHGRYPRCCNSGG
jgi:hypothetical protein